MPVLKRLGANRANTYIAALGQLARHHLDWLRPTPMDSAQAPRCQPRRIPISPSLGGASAGTISTGCRPVEASAGGPIRGPRAHGRPQSPVWTMYAALCTSQQLQTLYEGPHRAHGPLRLFVWTIYELCTSQQLQTEGRIMGHCVFSYTERCLAGDTSIWSLRALNADAEEALEKRVLTIAVDNRQRAVTQARGKFNMALNQRERLEKRRRAGSLYVHLLRESARILRLWSDKVGLVQKGT